MAAIPAVVGRAVIWAVVAQMMAIAALLFTSVLLSQPIVAQQQDAPENVQPQQPQIVPVNIPLSPLVNSLAEDDLLTEDERRTIQLRHGLLDRIDTDQRNTAAYALASYDLLNPILHDPAQPVLTRAEAALLRGDMKLAIDWLAKESSPESQLIVGRALIGLGRFEEAIATLTPLRTLSQQQALTEAPQITAAAEATAELADLEGRPAADYHHVINELSRAQQQVDRLYYPALIAQGALLVAKDNPQQAVEALQTALTFNPTSSQAWYLLGRVALDTFNFDSAKRAAGKLRAINPNHVLAFILDAEIALTQKDTPAASQSLEQGLQLYPNHRRLLAANAAVAALTYDEDQLDAALQRYDDAAGRNHLAYFLAGNYLSFARQYEKSQQMLTKAIERQPNDPHAYIELGLVLSQAGQEEEALAVLRRASNLDPFNKRAANTLKLHEELAGYSFIETDHFVVKYRDPIDGALAADMPDVLERFYSEVTSAFSHEPGRKTFIEILPDKRWFAVRITGMPWVWTIGAATGPVIAITPPREGSHQAGHFDWPRVIRHEYTHTVTLDQTQNRIPHWFTEACAVSQEPGPRDFETTRMLADALKKGELFDLTEINWAFVRPKRPQDRGLAYAQAHWMFQFITERFGHETILEMLRLASRGTNQADIIPTATQLSESEFLTAFHEWAGEEVKAWGLDPKPSFEQIVREISNQYDDEAGDAGDEQEGDAKPGNRDQLLAETARKLAVSITEALNKKAGETAAESDAETDTETDAETEHATQGITEDTAEHEAESNAEAAVREQTEAAADTALIEALDSPALFDQVLEKYPNHPDLLRIASERALEHAETDPQTAFNAVQRYAAARPVDPWSDTQLAQLALQMNRPADAAPHLEQLDLQDQTSGHIARQLVDIYRKLNQLDDAQRSAQRALDRQPYDAKMREIAATIALQRRDTETALRHLRAITLIEPDRSIHFTRLAALLSRLGRTHEAHEAALQARELDADAPVDAFLSNN